MTRSNRPTSKGVLKSSNDEKAACCAIVLALQKKSIYVPAVIDCAGALAGERYLPFYYPANSYYYSSFDKKTPTFGVDYLSRSAGSWSGTRALSGHCGHIISASRDKKHEEWPYCKATMDDSR